MQPHTSDAILLRSRPLREADLLCTYLTPDHGQLTGVAAHARRSQRRFGAACEPGTIGTIRFAERPGHSLVRVEEMRVVWSPLTASPALPVFAASGVVLEVALATTVERQHGPEKFYLLRQTLPAIGTRPREALVQWLIAWCGAIGLAPCLEHCVRCRRPWPATVAAYFVADEGGIVCQACRTTPGSSPRPMLGVTIAPAGLQAWLTGGTGGLVEPEGGDAREALWQYVRHVAGRALRSQRYWELLWNG